jgi:hypothetical protein
MEEIKIKVQHDNSEHKIPIFRTPKKALPGPIEFAFVCEMADKANKRVAELRQEIDPKMTELQAAIKDASLWEGERWYMRQSLNRFNRV